MLYVPTPFGLGLKASEFNHCSVVVGSMTWGLYAVGLSLMCCVFLMYGLFSLLNCRVGWQDALTMLH